MPATSKAPLEDGQTSNVALAVGEIAGVNLIEIIPFAVVPMMVSTFFVSGSNVVDPL